MGTCETCRCKGCLGTGWQLAMNSAIISDGYRCYRCHICRGSGFHQFNAWETAAVQKKLHERYDVSIVLTTPQVEP